MYYSAIGVLALLILLIENRVILLNRSRALDRPAWKAYRRFLLAVLVYCLTDILWGLLESAGLARLLFADTILYYVAMALGVLCWTEFAVAYLGEKRWFARFLVIAGRVLAGAITLLTLVNIFVPVLFTVDGESVYRPLPFRYGMLACQILLLLLTSAYAVAVVVRNPSEKRPRYRTLALFGLIMSLFLFVQLWFPYLPLYTIAYLLGTCLLHTFVVSKETEEYRRDLKKVNDTAGHQAGDQYLWDACQTVCHIFKHSPVFRVGGDEFVVIAQGQDYENLDALMERMREHNAAAVRNGGIVIACGMARHRNEALVAPVFALADQNMYENKARLKELGK